MNFDEVVAGTLEELSALIATRGLVIDEALGAGGLVDADHDRLVQAITNLMTNACRFARREIRIRTTDQGQGVELTIEDDGPGIQEDLLPRVFERFVHTGGSGTGLGLSIVYGIAVAHGGTVHASNRPEGGARFSLFIPANALVTESLP
jgi:signal transduction histidine kinase